MRNNTVLGLATHGAYAQSLTLHSGDHITADGTGTHGIMDGRRVDNKITAYTSHGKVFGVDNDAVQVNGTATFTLGSGGTITGGQFSPALATENRGAILVSGGTITSGKYGPALVPAGSGTTTVIGGKIKGKPQVHGHDRGRRQRHYQSV